LEETIIQRLHQTKQRLLSIDVERKIRNSEPMKMETLTTVRDDSPKPTNAGQSDLQGRKRREVPRYPFVANAEEIDIDTGAKVSACVLELSLKGCYLDTLNPFPKGTQIRLVIFHGDSKFTALVTVMYSQPNLGMGARCKAVEPEQLEVLRTWLAESNGR
jgi:hypothetical protein